MIHVSGLPDAYLEGMRLAAAHDFASAVERFWAAQMETTDGRIEALCLFRASQSLSKLGQERDANEWLLRAEQLAISALADETLINIGHTWAARGNVGRASNALRVVLDREHDSEDRAAVRLRALAAYELACLAIENGSFDAAGRLLTSCAELQVEEVAPFALLTYARELSGRLSPIERETALLQAVDYDHPDASPRAAVELGRLYLRGLATDAARDYLERALRSNHADVVEDAKALLDRLEGDDTSKPGFASNWQEPTPPGHRRVLVCGAGTGAQDYTLSVADARVHIVAYLDDAYERLQARGAPVFGPLSTVEQFITAREVDDVVFAIPSAAGAVRRFVFDACRRTGVRMHDVPSMYRLDVREPIGRQLDHPVSVDALIGSQLRVVDREAPQWVRNQRVLILGAGCALGREMSRRAAKVGASRLVVVDQSAEHRRALERELERLDAPQGQALAAVPFGEHFDVVFIIVEPSGESSSAHSPESAGTLPGGGRPAMAHQFDEARECARAYAKHGARVVLVMPYVPDRAITACQRRVEYTAMDYVGELSGSLAAVRVGETLRGHHGPLTQMETDAEDGGAVTLRGPFQRRMLTVERACELVYRASRNATNKQTLMTDAGEELSLNVIGKLVAQRYERLGGQRPPVVATGAHIADDYHHDLLMEGETKRPSICCPELAVVKRRASTNDDADSVDPGTLAEGRM